jgi:hypothetical protein
MSIRKELINLTIINNSNSNFTIPLFQNGVASINSTIKYSYDITSASLTCGQGDIIINGVVYNFTYQPNVNAAVTALTNLGFGFFSYEIIGLNTYIYVVDNTNVYGDMNLCLLVPTTSTTTTTTTPIPTTTTTTSTTTTTTTPIPTTTTTTSTTTTTTTASLLYLTDQYVCGTCTLLANNVIVGSNFSLDILDYFLGDDGNVYQILGFTTGVPVTTISDNTAYASCVGIPCLTTTTSTTTTTTTPIPTTTTTTSTTTTTTAIPPTTSTTTTTTTLALLRTFRVLNSSLVNSITLDVQVDSVQVITPTLIPANTAVTLTPQVNCASFTNVTLEYQLVAGYTPTSATFTNGGGTYTGSIAGGFITFTGVDLTPNTLQDLNVNP